LDLTKISKYLAYLRVTPFEVNSEYGRSQERYRLAFLTAFTNLLSKGVMMLVMILSVKLALPYLGVERFGVWMTIASLAALLNFMDLGIGNALTNRVAKIATPAHQEYLGRCIGAGLLVLLFAALISVFCLYLIAEFFPWHSLLKITNKNLINETHEAIKIFVFLFSINIFTGGINRVFFGLQKGYLANLWNVAGSLLSLLLIWTTIQYEYGISGLLTASMAGGIITSFSLLVLLIFRKQISLRNLAGSIPKEMPYLLKIGGGFFLLQIGTIVVVGGDSLIIASSLGVVAVATYSVMQKMFQVVTQPFAVINSSLWPAYANAKEHGDKSFIRKTLVRSMTITVFGSTILSLLLLISGKAIISWWTHGEVEVSYFLIASFGLWAVVDSSASAFAMFMNGASIIKAQIGGLISLISLGMPLKIYLVNAFGVEIMLIGFSLFFLINIFFWYGIIYKKTISNNF
jgi:O-antigen/teichoic acid export membrane protein